jgi:hypothetical protein
MPLKSGTVVDAISLRCGAFCCLKGGCDRGCWRIKGVMLPSDRGLAIRYLKCLGKLIAGDAKVVIGTMPSDIFTV